MYTMETLDMSSLACLGLGTGLDTETDLSSSVDFNIFQSPSEMEIFTDLAGIEEVEVKEEEELSSILTDIIDEVGIGSPDSIVSDLEKNQLLIDEVENYLKGSEGSFAESVDESWSQQNLAAETDKIFEALTSGNVMMDTGSLLNKNDLKNAYTTSVTGKNGENVIIIIAPPSPQHQDTSYLMSSNSNSSFSFALSPSPSAASPAPSAASPAPSASYTSNYESDVDWSPNSVSSPITSTRRKYQRKVRSTPPSAPYPKEKGERKKAQNRSAAYKYREKKKAEQDLVDSELLYLANRNTVLKRKLSDMEVELKCLKKLMKETGLSP